MSVLVFLSFNLFEISTPFFFLRLILVFIELSFNFIETLNYFFNFFYFSIVNFPRNALFNLYSLFRIIFSCTKKLSTLQADTIARYHFIVFVFCFFFLKWRRDEIANENAFFSQWNVHNFNSKKEYYYFIGFVTVLLTLTADKRERITTEVGEKNSLYIKMRTHSFRWIFIKV